MIRYFCKDCNEPLCGECVVLHSKHDFVKADFKASAAVRMQLYTCIDTMDSQIKLYNTVLAETNAKLKEMEGDSKR